MGFEAMVAMDFNVISYWLQVRAEALCAESEPLTLTAVQLATVSVLAIPWVALDVARAGPTLGNFPGALESIPWGLLLLAGPVGTGEGGSGCERVGVWMAGNGERRGLRHYNFYFCFYFNMDPSSRVCVGVRGGGNRH